MLHAIIAMRYDKMKQKKKFRSIFGNIMITMGLFLFVAALALVLYNVWDGKRAERASTAIVEELEKVIPDKVEEPEEVIVPEGLEPEIDPTMPTEMIDGYAYIGTLKIPALGLNLPVMAECDYTRLKISPCVFSGSYKTSDLVICAHNYARHFSPVKWIDLGADVYLTTVDGVMYSYKVSNIETVQPMAVDQMIKNSHNDKTVSNDWDMTLFTCNTGGQTRCAVRCIRMDK